MTKMNWTREKKNPKPSRRIRTRVTKNESPAQKRKRVFNEAKLQYCREQCKDVTIVNFAQANCVTSCQKKRLPNQSN